MQVQIEAAEMLDDKTTKGLRAFMEAVTFNEAEVPAAGDAIQVVPPELSDDGKFMKPPRYVFVNRRIFAGDTVRLVIENAPVQAYVSTNVLREKLRNVVIENAHKVLTVEQSVDMLTNVVSELLKGKTLNA